VRVQIIAGNTTEEPQDWSVRTMLLKSLIALTDNRKRMAILSFLTFAVLC
jgi:hypothetical protein